MPPREPIPDEIRRFILTSIPSVPFVEAVLIFRALNGQPVHNAKVAERLYVGETEGAALVEQLRAARIIEAVPGDADSSRYAPDPELACMLDQLAFHYVHDLIGITQLIHSHTERVARRFADAFKFRKEP